MTKLAKSFFFFYLRFLSQTFTSQRTAGEGGGHFFNFSLPPPPAAESSPLHIAVSRTQTGAFGFQAQVPNHQIFEHSLASFKSP